MNATQGFLPIELSFTVYSEYRGMRLSRAKLRKWTALSAECFRTRNAVGKPKKKSSNPKKTQENQQRQDCRPQSRGRRRGGAGTSGLQSGFCFFVENLEKSTKNKIADPKVEGKSAILFFLAFGVCLDFSSCFLFVGVCWNGFVKACADVVLGRRRSSKFDWRKVGRITAKCDCQGVPLF